MKNLFRLLTAVVFVITFISSSFAQGPELSQIKDYRSLTKMEVRNDLWSRGVDFHEMADTSNDSSVSVNKKRLDRLSDELKLSLDNLKI